MHPRSGFTLVELSIVLVIIGLIAGGVLVGRDLIEAAAIRQQITQVERFKTAVQTFRTKYNGLPGDLESHRCHRLRLYSRAAAVPDMVMATAFWNIAMAPLLHFGLIWDVNMCCSGTTSLMPA